MEKNKNLKMKVAFSFLLGAFAVWYFFILSRTEKPVQKASAQLSCTLNIPATASATTALFNIRTTFYVLFATRNK